MSNVDLTQLITAEAKQATWAEAALAARKADCRRRIFAVADETAQMNLAAAAAAGVLEEEQMTVYRAGLAWIHAMRAACADGHWPEPPAEVVALAARF